MDLVNGSNNKELKDILKKIDDYSKSENKNSSSSSYTLEPQGTYLGIFSSSDSAYENIIDLSIIYKVTETKSDGSKEKIWISLQFNTTTDLEGLKSYLSNYKFKEYKQ